MPNSAVMITSSEKPGEPSGIAGRDEPDRLEAQEVGDGELERAGVLAAVDVDEQVAAALDHAGVDRQADAVGRLEAEREVGGAEVAVAVGREGQLDAQADVLDDGLQRAELALDGCAGFERDDARSRAYGQRGRDDLDRPELDVRGQADLETAAPAEVDALLARQPDEQGDVDDEAVPGEQRREEAVGVVARRLHDDATALEVELDEHVERAAGRSHAAHERHRSELDAARVARAGEHDRVSLAAVHRDAEAELPSDRRCSRQQVEQHLDRATGPYEDADAAGGVERAFEHDRDVVVDVDRLLEVAARVRQHGEARQPARARVRERVDADARGDLVLTEARAQQRHAHEPAVGVGDGRALRERRLDGPRDAVERGRDAEGLGGVGDVVDERLLVEVGLAEPVGVAEDRAGVVEQLGDVLPRDHAAHELRAGTRGGDHDEPDHPGELEQLADARLVVEEVLDREVVDELARELGDELGLVDGRRQAGRAPEPRDRAERRPDRLQQRRRGVRVDLAALHQLAHRPARRLERGERREARSSCPSRGCA